MIGVVTAPTPYADLNDLLDRFVRGAQTALGENFCGAYLQGSFAVGDADEYSDVDFIVLTTDEITDDQQTALQEMHARMYELETPWAQHLEGSYIPRGRIRHVDPTRAPYFYLDNGASRLEWDNHCNTAIVRWSLREHGLVLAGPEIKTLVDPVTAATCSRACCAVVTVAPPCAPGRVAVATAATAAPKAPANQAAAVPGSCPSHWRPSLARPCYIGSTRRPSVPG